MQERTPVDLWFDPFCPFAWLTSRWLLEVERVRPIEVRWHLMSLHILNAGKEVSESYREQIRRAIEPVRVIEAAREKYGDHVVGPLYTEIGTRMHDQRGIGDLDRLKDLLAEALEAADLAPQLAEATDSDAFDAAIKESHDRGIGLVGQEVGTPVVSVQGAAFFGPVINSIPRGEDAGRLWDGVRILTEFDNFFELKRTRTGELSYN